jgi:hypothetical protein
MFKSIAFGGGGVRGALHIGALAALQKVQGNLQFPNGIYGSSVGSIIATAIAFNLSVDQLMSILHKHFHLNTFLPSLKLSHLQTFPTKKGLFDTSAIEKTLTESFREYGVDLTDKTIGDAPQKLFILATDLTNSKATLLTGKVPVLQAIRASCAIPFVFQPVDIYGHLYVDGSVRSHHMHSIVPKDCLILHINYPLTPVSPATLDDMSLNDYMMAIYETSRRTTITPNTLWLKNTTISILQDIQTEHKNLMFDEGYTQTLEFLTKRAAEEGKESLC